MFRYSKPRGVTLSLWRDMLRLSCDGYFEGMSRYEATEAVMFMSEIVPFDIRNTPVTVQQLVESLGLSRSTVFRKLDAYERKGFIVREGSVVHINPAWLEDNPKADVAHFEIRKRIKAATMDLVRIEVDEVSK